MLIRAQGPLTAAYILLILAGVFFTFTPSITLADETGYNSLLVIWSTFYLAGGAVSLSAVVARSLTKKTPAMWYFEVAGLALTITANLVYAYVLIRSGLFYGEYNIVALGLILSAFTASLLSRCIEAIRFVNILKSLASPTEPTLGK